MPCDEQYRAWAMRQAPGGAGLPAPELRRAVLTGAGPCPARAGFRELRFDAGGAPWSWCFPGTEDVSSRVPRALIRAVTCARERTAWLRTLSGASRTVISHPRC